MRSLNLFANLRWLDLKDRKSFVVQHPAGIDVAKGLLMVLVIFGHTFSVPKEENLVRWILYGFHMPAFLYISGFLLRREKLISLRYVELLISYARRLVLPWLLVTGLFLIIRKSPVEMIMAGEWDALISRIFLFPYFHLWYIPALLVGISLLWLFSRLNVSVAVGMGIALALYFLFTNQVRGQFSHELLEGFNRKYLGYFLFLYLGFVVRNSHLKFKSIRTSVLFAIFGLSIFIVGFYDRGWYSPIGFLVLNLSLISIYPTLIAWFDRIEVWSKDQISSAGRFSLWLYLLHPLITVPFIRATDEKWFQALSGLLLAYLLTVAFGMYMIWYDKFKSTRIILKVKDI
jgi:fucose 4-O-acetylase-like acetyltransferase